MLTGWSADAQAQIQSGAVRLAILLYVAAVGTPVRAWSGPGDFTLTADNVDLTGGTYLGVGELVGVPTLQALINGAADRVEFTVSGVTPEIKRLADADAATVRSAPAAIGVLVLGANEQPISPAAWLWEGEADRVRFGRTAGEMDGAPTHSVTLSVGSWATGRRRPGFSNFTDADHRRRHPSDRFFDRVALYSQTATKTWPA